MIGSGGGSDDDDAGLTDARIELGSWGIPWSYQPGSIDGRQTYAAVPQNQQLA